MEEHILFILGWSASALVIISLFMKSMMRMRWISLVGGIIYAGYGLLFGSMPLFGYNILRAIVNVHFLRKLYTKRDLFDVLHVPADDAYLLCFIKAFLKDIQKFKPDFSGVIPESSYCIFALRNAQVVGLVITHNGLEGEIVVDLDYAVPQYRDFKSAQFVMEKYAHSISRMASHGLKYFTITGGNSEYNKFLLRIGYELIDGNNLYRMSVETLTSRYLNNVH